MIFLEFWLQPWRGLTAGAYCRGTLGLPWDSCKNDPWALLGWWLEDCERLTRKSTHG